MFLKHQIGIYALVACLTLARVAASQAKTPPQPSDVDLLRSLPAVYMVRTHGEGKLTIPNSVAVKLDGLDAEFNELLAAGKLPTDINRATFKWLRVAQEPDRYLTPSAETRTLGITMSGHGSAFAVRGDGILLTNRHVVAEKTEEPLDMTETESLDPPSLAPLHAELAKQIGDGPQGVLAKRASRAITLWYGFQCRQTTQLRRAEILLSYGKQSSLGTPDRLASGWLGLDTREGVIAPAIVLKRGGEEPVNDVAILQLDVKAAGDALICLPLAADAAPAPDVAISSLGFPGIRYNLDTMTALELLQVNVSSGKVLARDSASRLSLSERTKRRLVGASGEALDELLLVSAKQWCGVSGGPVVNAAGEAIGLNVRGNPCQLKTTLENGKFTFELLPEGTGAINYYAVPIRAAKKLLNDANITADVGESTRLWREGLDLYRRGDYAAALDCFRDISRRQKIGVAAIAGQQVVGRKPYEQVATNEQAIVNQYVVMLQAAAKEIAQGK